MTKETRKKTEPIVSWVLAMILCPLGISFSVKSAFGVSMIEAPVYVLHLKISQYWSWFSFGTSEYVLQALLLAVMCLVIRRFRWQYLLSFGTAFLYGQVIDFWDAVLVNLTANTLAMRILFAAIGCFGIGFSVAMFFRTWLPLEIWELFVKEIAEKFRFNIHKTKWVYDIGSLLTGVVLMLLFFGTVRWDAIGIGTVVTALINAPLIALSTKLQDKFWNAITKE